MLGLLPWSDPAVCSGLSSLLGFLLLASKGPLLSVFILSITFSPPLVLGLFGPRSSSSLSAGHLPSNLEPSPREGARSVLGVFRPLLVDGLLLEVLEAGNGGNAQSKFAESSGLGGRGSKIRAPPGLVALREGGGRPPKLLPDRELRAGDIGDSGRAIGARNGLLAVSGLIRGGAGRGALGACPDPSVGVRILVCGAGCGFCSDESNCSGEGVAGFEGFTALGARSAKGLPFELALLPLLEVLVTDECADDGAACPQRCSPMADISICSPQFEHLIVGKKLAGRAPPALNAAARDMAIVC